MATSPKKAAALKARPTGKGLRVLAKREGFRRAGFCFGSAPVDVALSDITEEQEALLRDEPMLLLVDIDLPDAQAESTGDAE